MIAITVIASSGRVKVRPYGIDCPEMIQPGGNKAFGLAFKLMHQQIVGETVVDRKGREAPW
ncbi:MAG: hypothetical protein R6W92_09935 [Desulfocurvibacter africanus]